MDDEDRLFSRVFIRRYLSGDSYDMRKCVSEGVIEVPDDGTIRVTGDLGISNDEVVAFGGGNIYEELYITLHRGGRRKNCTFNLADILRLFNYKRVRITVEVLEE